MAHFMGPGPGPSPFPWLGTENSPAAWLLREVSSEPDVNGPSKFGTKTFWRESSEDGGISSGKLIGSVGMGQMLLVPQVGDVASVLLYIDRESCGSNPAVSV